MLTKGRVKMAQEQGVTEELVHTSDEGKTQLLWYFGRHCSGLRASAYFRNSPSFLSEDL